MTAHEGVTPTPTRARLVGLLIGTGLATIFALGPLVSAFVITVGVETQVGEASGLPDARMLAAALEGVAAVATLFLLTRRPVGRLRVWCVWLVFVSLAAGMLAQGAHAIWYDEARHHLELPWAVKLLVSFVPPVSGLATVHLVVKMALDLIDTVGQLVATSRATSEPMETKVLQVVRANPHVNWKAVRDATGLSDSNAKRALTAARKRLHPVAAQAVEPNGRS